MPAECKICRSDYALGAHAPLMLSCGHTTCRSCLERIECQGEIKCPDCSRYHEGPPVQDLIVNLDLIEQEDVRTPESSSDDKTESSYDPLYVVVRNLENGIFRLNIKPQDTINKILTMLNNQYGLDVDDVTLLHKSNRLQNQDTVAKCKITTGDEIHLVAKFKGGIRSL
ncbi:RNA polymerase II transcription factor B subunit 3-like isoform X1 [Penaeus japonicus]|uniref:RNA polymerase II transcription factor B subunit 3-like isoform X1 n=1 Tax=Penaeus japonicus TaxID=27405 RepID=UPI001C70BB16|nr:RNA polymerase II transcription factor B subunit 3-like isoform X1 [Penaeus japonicus]